MELQGFMERQKIPSYFLNVTKLGSKANSKGIYNDHPIVNTETSLIFKIIANDTKK